MDNTSQQIPFDAEVLSRTPSEIVEFLFQLLAENLSLREENQILREKIAQLESRIEELEAKLNKNSSNSNKPSSSDSPFLAKPETPRKDKKPRKRKGTRQQCLRPTEIVELQPEPCSCGCADFSQLEPYYIHQVIELPEVKMDIQHSILYRGNCAHCGKLGKAYIPPPVRTGFGPRFSAPVVELCGGHGDSRRAAQDLLFSVFGIPISQGAIQNILERASQAIEFHYESIKEVVHTSKVNHADETSWKRKKTLEWLWLLCSLDTAFFMVHASRSKEAFAALVAKWRGILVSDDYGTYIKWEHGRQTCLAHLIRTAKGLSERQSSSFSKPGAWLLNELRLLCRMSKHPPSNGDWNAHCARMQRLTNFYQGRDDKERPFCRAYPQPQTNVPPPEKKALSRPRWSNAIFFSRNTTRYCLDLGQRKGYPLSAYYER